MDLIKHIHFVKNKRKENLKFFKKLNNTKPKVLDKIINSTHETVFKGINCLQCANCCKTTSPLFTDKDIQRISKFLKIKPSIFVEKYLVLDDDNDYVLKSLPCVFLNDNNECRIYKVRPKACRNYPHTDRVKQYQLLKLTQKNIEICPAVSQIIERIKLKLN